MKRVETSTSTTAEIVLVQVQHLSLSKTENIAGTHVVRDRSNWPSSEACHISCTSNNKRFQRVPSSEQQALTELARALDALSTAHYDSAPEDCVPATTIRSYY